MGKRLHCFMRAAVVVLSVGRPALAQQVAAPQAAEPQWPVVDMNTLPDDAWGRAVRLGRDLTVATPRLIGPEVSDPARRFAGNNMSCQNCHLNAGTAKFAVPFVGVFADFPQYRPREGGVHTIEERINGCMTRSLNGRDLPLDGPEMRALVSYMKFLSTGIPVGAKTPGRGTSHMALLDRAADPARGAAVYGRICAACHGANGAGQRVGIAGDAKGYAVPPLWGPDSFNDGAGMARLITSAGFVHGNMPAGTTWQAPILSAEDAWDVAAFVESQPRPHMADLERDFPNRLQKPVDAAYGPYADDFSQEQHRLGPFQPIKDAVAAMKKRDPRPLPEPTAPAGPANP